jgi:hypothetical protein
MSLWDWLFRQRQGEEELDEEIHVYLGQRRSKTRAGAASAK